MAEVARLLAAGLMRLMRGEATRVGLPEDSAKNLEDCLDNPTPRPMNRHLVDAAREGFERRKETQWHRAWPR